ncbi:hypothetical protein PVAG01_11344 [Phlyctema vagabunda]|uniref:Zn(2)-C6 fungal-type domain-containing protein n=1 Tax=Phlyctema vagabunda TaxID=108571 RepID=A0ABR4P216_9HELO
MKKRAYYFAIIFEILKLYYLGTIAPHKSNAVQGMMQRAMDHGSARKNKAHTSSRSHQSQQSLSTTNACDQCHRRKLRCSRHEPACDGCQKQQRLCTYSLSRPVGRPRQSATDGRWNPKRSNRTRTGDGSNEFFQQGDLHSTTHALASSTLSHPATKIGSAAGKGTHRSSSEEAIPLPTPESTSPEQRDLDDCGIDTHSRTDIISSLGSDSSLNTVPHLSCPPFANSAQPGFFLTPDMGEELLDIDFNHLNQLDSTDFETSTLQPDGPEKEQCLCLSDVLCCINDRLSTPAWQSQDPFTALNETMEQLTMCERFHTMYYLILLPLYQDVGERLSLYNGYTSLPSAHSETLMPAGLTGNLHSLMAVNNRTTSNIELERNADAKALRAPTTIIHEHSKVQAKVYPRSQLERRTIMKAFATLSVASSVMHLRFNEVEIGVSPELALIHKQLHQLGDTFKQLAKEESRNIRIL